MTSPSVSSELYGPVRDDVGKVDDLITSLRPKDFPFLSNILDHVLEAGGKRVRPAVALLAGKLGRYDLDLLIPLAASIELVHSASLVHDDVIDAAATRRGRATANALFNNAATVMVGDYMFANAADLVARTGNVEVVRLFARTLMEMTTGELQQDMSAYEYGQDTRKYFDRIYGKTASLFAAAAQGGGDGRGSVGGAVPGAAVLRRERGHGLPDHGRHPRLHGRRDGAGQAGGQRPDERDADAAGAAADRARPGGEPGEALLRRAVRARRRICGGR